MRITNDEFDNFSRLGNRDLVPLRVSSIKRSVSTIQSKPP